MTHLWRNIADFLTQKLSQFSKTTQDMPLCIDGRFVVNILKNVRHLRGDREEVRS